MWKATNLYQFRGSTLTQPADNSLYGCNALL